MRAIGIPGFGLGIPHALGLFGPIGPDDPRFWLGTFLFLALAFALWQGNRWLLFEQQKRFDWLERPLTKVVMLVLAVVLYTAPLTASTLLAWYAWAGLPPDVDAIRATTLTNVICVVFVTHAYETVLLVKARESDRVRVARLDAARLEAELAAFRAQVDPHFLFNCLNTLAHLVETDAPRAREMTERMADVYRYLLAHQRRALVSVEDERAFTLDYVFLLRLRFSEALSVEVRGEPAPGASIPPTALQLLVENAVKHNEVSERYPLCIDIDFTHGDRVIVSNARRARRSLASGRETRTGLANLAERVRLVAPGSELVVRDEAERFVVEVPVVRGGA